MFNLFFVSLYDFHITTLILIPQTNYDPNNMSLNLLGSPPISLPHHPTATKLPSGPSASFLPTPKYNLLSCDCHHLQYPPAHYWSLTITLLHFQANCIVSTISLFTPYANQVCILYYTPPPPLYLPFSDSSSILEVLLKP